MQAMLMGHIAKAAAGGSSGSSHGRVCGSMCRSRNVPACLAQSTTLHAAIAVLAGAWPAPAILPQLTSSPASPQAAVTPTLQTASPSQAEASSLMEWYSPAQLACGQQACSSALASHVLQPTQHFLRAQPAQKTVWCSPGGQWQAVVCRSHVPRGFMGQAGVRVMPTDCALSVLRGGQRLKALRIAPATAEVRCSAV